MRRFARRSLDIGYECQIKGKSNLVSLWFILEDLIYLTSFGKEKYEPQQYPEMNVLQFFFYIFFYSLSFAE